MSSLKKTGILGSFTLGIGLLLTACTIKTPDSDDDESGGAGADAGTAGSTGGTYAGGTGSGGTGGAATGGSAGSTSGTGGNSGTGGSSATGSSGGTAGTAATGGGANYGGTGGSANDNCPDDPSSEQTDTDLDGQGNPCDADDDQDGFLDAADPAPLDVDVPGDFSTPEKVLADPRMLEAIEALRDAGFALETHLETDPPDVTGYFRKEEGVGEFVANSGGDGVGTTLTGTESRTQLSERGTLETAGITFSGDSADSFSIVSGQSLRGTGNEYTIYRTLRSVCTESGSDYVRFSVAIRSGTVAANGDLIDILSLTLTVATEGELSSECADRINGLTENEDEWNASSVPLDAKVEPSEFEFMCVDGDSGYVPTETWTRDGQACECTTDYAVSCAAP